VAELLETYFDDSSRLLVAMQEALSTGNAEDLRRAAHSLKSSSASFGALRLSNKCKELEDMGRAGALEGAASRSITSRRNTPRPGLHWRQSRGVVRMGSNRGHILVVDDSKINRMMLARAVEKQGHQVTTAQDGRQALALLRSAQAGPFDVILLDVLMPEMDGYQVLEQVKGDSALRHIPVIMISALDEMDSAIRCIEMGATDYLPKPFNPALLQARLDASLAEKRLRDLELEYLEQVNRVVGAAKAVEAATFDPDSLSSVAARDDALGQLARVFQRMAREVHLREQRLRQHLQQLHLDVEEMKRAIAEPLYVYMPMDRRQALVRGETLPDRTSGAALFADISGFTPLTAALAQELGPQRGAEELARLLNQVYGALIAEVHRYGGSVIGFGGDAITCWMDEGTASPPRSGGSGDSSPTVHTQLRRTIHRTIRRVTADVEAFKFNTAIAALMECLNEMSAHHHAHGVTPALAEATRTFVLLLAPFAPHVAEELWARLGGPYSVHQQLWPAWDEALAAEETVTLVVQVNGKVRARIEVPAGISEDEAKEIALSDENVQCHIGSQEIRKAIYVPGRLVSVVTDVGTQ